MISPTLPNQDFNHIITGYCKNRAGNRYVERGDYHVVRAKDNKKISPSELAMEVQSGMVLEMSIILRQRATFLASRRMCPRCRCINFNVTTTNSWIGWKVFLRSACVDNVVEVVNYSRYCSVRFQVEKSDGSRGDDDGRTTATGDGQEHDGELLGEHARGEESYEEIVSRTSFVPLMLFFLKLLMTTDGVIFKGKMKVWIDMPVMSTFSVELMLSTNILWSFHLPCLSL
jgi:hypothetical protein